MALAGKATSSMKAMKAMKAKRVSKIAKGRMAKALVLRGSKEKTVGGLRKDSLVKNARGRVVSKRASANGKRRYKNIETWIESVLEARKALHVSGFVAINGKTLQGKALYLKSKAIRAARQSGVAESSSSSSAAAPASSPAKMAA
mmetsp:Transcript_59121/g.192907  ORF Transcript_59121/g.192907 Transcript_59121/m.192907 type:complete len:145 (+) Transcript_59121:74-508(+)